MVYKKQDQRPVNINVRDAGMAEIFKEKENNLERSINVLRNASDVRTALEEYYLAMKLARSLGMGTREYEDVLYGYSTELDRFEVEIK